MTQMVSRGRAAGLVFATIIGLGFPGAYPATVNTGFAKEYAQVIECGHFPAANRISALPEHAQTESSIAAVSVVHESLSSF
jgi:hypothetical protein